MLKLKDKSISAYKGDYRPVELFENAKKLHGFGRVGMTGEQASFENAYNDYLTVYGKSGYIGGTNLIPPPENYNSKGENGGYKLTVKEDGRFDFEGSMVTGVQFSRIMLCPGTYTASGCEYIKLWWSEKGDFLSLPATFTLEQESEVQAYFWYTADTELVLENQYIQIEAGETASEYTPYMGNFQYSVSPKNRCPVVSSSGSIRCEGGNLIPSDFCDLSSWEDTESADRKIKFLDLQPGKYIFSFNLKPLTTYMYLYLQRVDAEGNHITVGYPIMNEAVTNNISFEVREGYSYRFWSWRFVENISFFSDFQIKRVETPDGFYKAEPIINAEIPELKGLEVKGKDNYNYTETTESGEKHYISDFIKGNTLTRNIGEVVLTGDENIVMIEGVNDNYNTFAIDLSSYFKTNRNFAPAICNFFKILSSENEGDEGAVLGKNDKKLYLNTTEFSSVDAVLNWLKARYEGNNPVRLCYVLDTPVTEQLDAEKTLKSYPKFTRILVKNKNAQMPLGVSKIIKVQN